MAAEPNNFQYTARPRLPDIGEVVIAAGWLATIGLLNIFYGIAVIAGSDIFITTASWLVGDARPWGWLMLVVGLVQLAAAPAVLLARWAGFWICLLSILGHMAAAVMFISDWAAGGIALLLLDAVVLVCLLVGFGVLRSRSSVGRA